MILAQPKVDISRIHICKNGKWGDEETAALVDKWVIHLVNRHGAGDVSETVGPGNLKQKDY